MNSLSAGGRWNRTRAVVCERATIDQGWVQAHLPGTRWEAADGRVYVVDSVREASLIDVDDPRISAPLWVVYSYPAED